MRGTRTTRAADTVYKRPCPVAVCLGSVARSEGRCSACTLDWSVTMPSGLARGCRRCNTLVFRTETSWYHISNQARLFRYQETNATFHTQGPHKLISFFFVPLIRICMSRRMERTKFKSDRRVD